MHEVANNYRSGNSSDANLVQASLYEASYTADMTALLMLTWGFLTMGQPHVYEYLGDHIPADSIYIPSSPEADYLLLRSLNLDLDDTEPYSFWLYNSRNWMKDHMYIGCPNHHHIDPTD